jgi:hypothetical protein
MEGGGWMHEGKSMQRKKEGRVGDERDLWKQWLEKVGVLVCQL